MASCAQHAYIGNSTQGGQVIDYIGVFNAHKKDKPVVNYGVKAAVCKFTGVRETGVTNKPDGSDTEIMTIPGDNVRRLRQEKGWSMRELAERCVTEEKTMEHTTIMRLEKNQGFTQKTLMRVAEALGLDNYGDLFLPEDLAGIEKLDATDRAQISNMIQALALSSERRKAVSE